MKLFLLILTILFAFACGESALEEGDLVGDNDDAAATTYGDLSGVVSDARTGNGISSVTVSISGTAHSTTTNGSGEYSFTNVEVDNYSVVFSHGSYMGQTVSYDLEERNDNILNLSLLTTSYAQDKIAIVLTWDDDPQDLDSHLYVATDASTTFEVYYNATGDTDGTLDALPFAGLDVDDVDGDGPETVVLGFDGTNTHYPRTYRYFVNNFSHPAVTNFSDSNAVVRVYKEGILTNTIEVSSSATEKYWHVLDIDQNGNVSVQNNYSNSKPATLY